jgi:hypothetical protein
LLAVLPLIYFVAIYHTASIDVQGYVHVPMMYEEDLFIRQNLFAAEYKPSQVSPKLQLALI